MKFRIFFKLSLFFPCLILSFLFIVPRAGAEQPGKVIYNQIFASEGLTTLKGPIHTEDLAPIQQQNAVPETGKTSSFDVKVALNQKFNAVFSLGEQTIKDLAGRDSGRNYHAGVGLQLLFK